MRIDNHIHITPPDIIKNWERIADKEPYFKWLATSPQNRFVTSEEVVEELTDAGFDKGVVFGFAFRDAGLCRYVNDYCIASVQKYKEKLIGFMVTSPKMAQVDYEIERCIKAGLKGIGELFPEGQGYVLDDPQQMKPLMTACEHYQIPLLLHANEQVGHHYIGKTKTSLESLEKFVKTYTKSPIILAHLGGGLVFYEVMKRQKEAFKHVYYDTAAALFLYEPQVFSMIEAIGIEDKIIFGSDFPLVKIKRYEAYFMEGALKDEVYNGIKGGNLASILQV